MTGRMQNIEREPGSDADPESRYLHMALRSEVRVTDAFVSFGAPAIAGLEPEDLARRGYATPEQLQTDAAAPAYLPPDVIQRPEGSRTDYGLAA